ncbi:glycosyltransferase family 1 protein [Peribacillus muralis]|uniref:glycosyltransferase family 1 protein n=1 Tax=Peribacillus muralis TaxID=264697 RepID=UPI00070F56C9|nr:glycosyltransferase family 1 protein [Peribacillus muralis]
MTPIRILHIVSAMDRGGAETIIMNIYRNLDRNKIQFDFITHSTKKEDFEEEILALGGNIMKIPSLGKTGPLSYLKELKRIMSSKHYHAVHAHTDYLAGFPVLAAKMSGIKIRICHSHSDNWSKGNLFKERLTLKALQALMKVSANRYCSCSHEAAKFMFGKQTLRQGKVTILKNGINVGEFTGTKIDSRDRIMKEFGLKENAKIIGHVGRFSDSKNHQFILRLMHELVKNDRSFFALLVGDGPLRQEIEHKAKALGIMENIKFLGVRTDIPRLMKGFDVFLFPSLFEGFGIAALEAQGSGTPCILSDTIPKSIDMNLGLLSFISLNEPLDVWCNEVNASLLLAAPDDEAIQCKIATNGYDIYGNVKEWIKLYEVS